MSSGDGLNEVGSDSELHALQAELVALRHTLHDEIDQSESLLAGVHPDRKASAINLLHYLALRRRDMRPLQRRLAAVGLSSLGRAESHVLSSVDAVISVLRRLCDNQWSAPAMDPCVIGYAHGETLLRQHADDLLGVACKGRPTRIMVTMPREAADDPTLIRDLLKNGMECMRINCAHDSPELWARMISHLASARQALDRSCRVMMDLAGPKLRTGELAGDRRVLKLRPKRDEFGNILEPVRVRLTASDFAGPLVQSETPVIKVDEEWLSKLQVGDGFILRDARKAKRHFTIVDQVAGTTLAEGYKTTYLVPQTKLIANRKGSPEQTTSVSLPPMHSASILLKPGDSLILGRPEQPGREALRDNNGNMLEPARIGCSLPEIFDDVKPGEAIWFDDGQIGGVIESVHPSHLIVSIRHTPPKGGKLKSDKGINLPESNLRLSALTEKDRQDLRFIVRNADMIALSFANSARDVAKLQKLLDEAQGPVPAIIIKVETRRAFENLPEMLLTAMHQACSGVMIARGDLAVECGFERLAEIQEEILWLCEAAHMPVIWATQVLESLAKQGLPSRAEITDAAMGHRAECVMLNKGPHIVHAVRTLDNIMRRMQSHQNKKQAMMRELHVARPLPSYNTQLSEPSKA